MIHVQFFGTYFIVAPCELAFFDIVNFAESANFQKM